MPPALTRDQRGFAIPVTILLIVLITTLLSAGFVRVRADRSVAEASEVSLAARGIAQSGLRQFVETQNTRPPNGFADTMYVPGGYAIVRGWITQKPADTMEAQGWILQSTGYVIDPQVGSTPRARHTVGQFADWQIGYVLPRGGMVAANGVRIRRYGYVYLRGDDWGLCQPDTLVALRTAFLTNDGNSDVAPYGSPNLIVESSSEMAADTEIDWLSVRNGEIEPDATTLVSQWDYPVVYINGSLNVSTTTVGSGLLIVTGDLTITSSFIWFGVVLTGGSIRFRPPGGGGIAYLRGITVSGLNRQLGMSVGPSEFGDGSSYYSDSYSLVIYDSCQARYALAQLTGFSPTVNAHVTSWPMY